jgi:hypothetical protein
MDRTCYEMDNRFRNWKIMYICKIIFIQSKYKYIYIEYYICVYIRGLWLPNFISV